MTEQRRSYAGECVYVGVDVHKETYTVTCVCHKQIVKTATVQAEPASLAASLPRWFPGATLYSVYEAGFSAFVLHRSRQRVAHPLATIMFETPVSRLKWPHQPVVDPVSGFSPRLPPGLFVDVRPRCLTIIFWPNRYRTGGEATAASAQQHLCRLRHDRSPAAMAGVHGRHTWRSHGRWPMQVLHKLR
jgi:hypothetical protein